MELITELLEKRFAEIGRQGKDNPLVIAKFFNPTGPQTWHITEYDPKTRTCYGYFSGREEKKWECFPLDKLEKLPLPFGMSIERDCLFEEMHFDDIMKLPRHIVITQNIDTQRDIQNRNDEQQR